MRLHPTLHRRPGFTLIEVLVAAGLCMLIMSVLTFAFAAGIDTFSLLKSTGELNQRLTVAESILQGDLKSVHLEDAGGLPLKVSQVRYDLLNTASATDSPLAKYVRPPARGFFRIVQETVSTNEGNDPDGVPSTFATNHVLHMTVRRNADQPHRVFVARVPNVSPNPDPPSPTSTTASNAGDAWTSDSKVGLTLTQEYPLPTPNTSGRRVGDFGYRLQRECVRGLSGLAVGTDVVFASPWAEVVYFLRATGTNTSGGGRQLFSLHRRIRVLTRSDNAQTQLNWGTFQTNSQGMSCSPTGLKPLNGPGDVTNPNNRMGGLASTRVTAVGGTASGANIDAIGATADATGTATGEDILLTNVVSFEVKASWDANPAGAWVIQEGDPAPPAPVGPAMIVLPPNAAEFPYDDLPQIPSVPKGFTQTRSIGPAPVTITFPNGSGNNGNVNPATDFFARNVGGTVRVYDTWGSTGALSTWNNPVVTTNPTTRQPNPNCVPLPIRLKAVQIKLRIFDPKNKLTRQITLVQDV